MFSPGGHPMGALPLNSLRLAGEPRTLQRFQRAVPRSLTRSPPLHARRWLQPWCQVGRPLSPGEGNAVEGGDVSSRRCRSDPTDRSDRSDDLIFKPASHRMRELLVPDPMRLVRLGAETALLVRLVGLVVPFEPDHLGLPLEG